MLLTGGRGGWFNSPSPGRGEWTRGEETVEGAVRDLVPSSSYLYSSEGGRAVSRTPGIVC